MNCNFCHKPYSVKPVKLYKGKIRCGRCGVKKGVFSCFNNVIDYLPFGCVNRFDGCRAIVFTSNILKHEEECIIRSHSCTICSENVPIYLMKNHFEEHHASAFLEDNAFFLTLTANMVSAEYIFLYIHTHHIISIHVKLTLTGTKIIRFQPIIIRANPVCREVIHLKMYLQCTKRKSFVSKFKPVDIRDSGRVDTEHCFELPSSFLQDSFQMFIAFDVKESLFETQHVEKPSTSQSTKLRYFQQCWWRTILFDTDFVETFKFYTIRDQTIWDTTEDRPIFPFCLNCKALARFGEDYDKAVYTCLNITEYHFLCFHCHLYFKKKNRKVQTVATFKVFPFEIYKKVKYQCSWGCNNFLNCVEIYNHESSCEQQQKILCSCNQQILIRNFCDHFQRFHHSGDPVEFNSYLHPYSFLYSSSHNTKISYTMIWVLKTLIAIQFNHSKNVTMVNYMCHSDNSQEWKKTFKLLIFNPEDTKLLGIIEESGGKVKKLKSFIVKCFWEYD